MSTLRLQVLQLAPSGILPQSAAPNQDVRVYDVTMLVPGIYTPGIGNADGLRILFGRALIERIAETMEGKPVNLEHKRDVDNEVGFVQNVRVDDGRLKGQIVLQATRTKFTDAMAFIESRIAAGLVPQVSVEIENKMVEPRPNADAFDAELVDGTFEGLAILPVGACGPEDGCGIGLGKDSNVLCLQGTTMGLVVPDNPEGGDQVSMAEWNEPTLSSFTTSQWGDLGETQKRQIAQHYAWAPKMPPDNFSDLKLPHHEPQSGAVNLNAVRNALARLSQTEGPSPTERDQIRAHLQAHLDQAESEDETSAAGSTEINLAEGNHVTNEQNTGGSPPPTQEQSKGCTCGGSGAVGLTEQHHKKVLQLEQAVEDKQAKIAEMEAELEKAKAELQETSERAESAEAKVEAHEKAEHEALTEAVKEAAPPGVDLKETLGEDPSTQELTVALKAFRAMGSKLGMGGRQTRATGRDGDDDPQKRHRLALERARLHTGVTKQEQKGILPPALARNNSIKDGEA